AGGAAGDDQADAGVALDFDGVGGILGSDVHLQFEIDEFFSAAGAASDLVNAGGLAGLHGEKFGLHTFLGDDRFDGFRDLIHGQVQAVRDHGHGFGQADVLDHPFGNFDAEFL